MPGVAAGVRKAGNAIGEVDFMHGEALVRAGDDEAGAVFFESCQGFCGGQFDDGEAEDRSGRGSGDLGIGGRDGAFGGEHAAGSKGFGAAEDGAEVSGVLEAGAA